MPIAIATSRRGRLRAIHLSCCGRAVRDQEDVSAAGIDPGDDLVFFFAPPGCRHRRRRQADSGYCSRRIRGGAFGDALSRAEEEQLPAFLGRVARDQGHAIRPGDAFRQWRAQIGGFAHSKPTPSGRQMAARFRMLKKIGSPCAIMMNSGFTVQT